ncbi:NYN domain-containing protein [Phycicoccus sp. HDW14]|uniref:NYN domain-containing protein n=1 Tax=Phycicoccus sp. HDW14 TaxID=2714941 RepID=UPI0014096C24|nr:NYN domain-containing protein [Phycicoccus sp. HDW14]QIM21810.1 NYN domain-containing protein [Phycicoccus sp. HDW14]
MTDTPRIALLIDADNARARRLDVVLNELSALGETTIRRAYGNWTKSELKGWQQVLHENAIRPMQQFDPSKGKNASDMALVVDAVEILHTQRPDAMAIVSSDSDFTPLVMHLREHGVAVYGFGDAKTPAAFQSACTRFLVLDRLSSPSGEATTDDEVPEPPRKATRKATAKATSKATEKATETKAATGGKKASARATAAASATAAAAPAAAPPTAPAAAPPANGTPERATRAQLRQDARLVSLLRGAVDSASDETGWAKIGTVGQRIARQSSFDSRNYGYAKLSKLIEASDLFEVRDAGTPDMAMRDPRAG